MERRPCREDGEQAQAADMAGEQQGQRKKWEHKTPQSFKINWNSDTN